MISETSMAADWLDDDEKADVGITDREGNCRSLRTVEMRH